MIPEVGVGPFIGDSSPYWLALLCVVLVGVGRVRRRVLLEVSAGHFSLAFMNRSRVTHRWTWPRRKIREVRGNTVNGKLLIRVTGEDLVEVYVGPYAEVGKSVAATVSAALDENFESPPSSSEAIAPSSVGTAGFPRTVLLALGFMFLAAAVAIVAYPWPYRPLAFAAIPFGLAYGTQDKKFFA
jgi:hypothetical protein